jgi:hypothetical protein
MVVQNLEEKMNQKCDKREKSLLARPLASLTST